MNDMAFSLRILARALGGDGRQPRRIGKGCPDAVDDGFAGHWKPAVAQDGLQLGLVHGGLESQQRTQLSIAILLDDENRGMQAQEAFDFEAEWEGLDAQVID